MAALPVRCTAFLAIILLLQSHVAAAATPDDAGASPILGSYGACSIQNVCGRGQCVSNSTASGLGFQCECEAGWMQAARPLHNGALSFLPCVIPNCTFNYTCAQAGPLQGYPETPYNFTNSNYTSCTFSNCGGGLCNVTSALTYNCICREGFQNLFNNPMFPCYRECAFQGGCLGFNTSTSVLDPNPILFYDVNSGSNLPSPSAASSIPGAEFACLIAVVTTLALVVWKYS